MKKWLSLILAMAMLLSLLTACVGKKKDEDDKVTVYLLTEEVVYQDGEETWRYEYAYNSDGNRENEACYSYGEEIWYNEMSYNSKGHWIGLDGYENGEKSWYEEYECDSKGNREVALCYDADDVEALRVEYSYDKNGNLIESVGYYPYDNGQESYRDEYTYDSKDRRTSYVRYEYGGELWCYEYSYDKNGNLEEEVYYLVGEEIWRIEFTYDKKGRLTEKVHYEYGKETWYAEYSYGKKGCEAEITYADGDSKTLIYEKLQVSEEEATTLLWRWGTGYVFICRPGE